jgi:hypothetical protein
MEGERSLRLVNWKEYWIPGEGGEMLAIPQLLRSIDNIGKLDEPPL